jgi:hypothetical protein
VLKNRLVALLLMKGLDDAGRLDAARRADLNIVEEHRLMTVSRETPENRQRKELFSSMNCLQKLKISFCKHQLLHPTYFFAGHPDWWLL